MSTAGHIRAAVRARNRELAREALLEAGLGVVFCMVIFGGVFWIAWLAMMFFFSRFDGSRATLYALAATAVYAVVATISAWRNVNPLANVRKLTEVEEDLMIAGPMLPYGIGMQPRHAVAGAAVVLLAGPGNVFEAIGTWRRRLPSNATIISQAAQTLQQAADEAPTAELAYPEAALLLHRLSLIRVVGLREKRITLTERGRLAVHEPVHR